MRHNHVAAILSLLAILAIAFTTPAQAGGKHRHRIHLDAPLTQTTSTYLADNEDSRYERPVTLSAARHHYRRGGACDGFHRCVCGTTAARHFGLPYIFKGFNLKMASQWARAFTHTSFRVGAAGVKPHHVLVIVGGNDCRSAMVSDERGTYQRNVCGMTFVSVGG
jgi:hypothetical protein